MELYCSLERPSYLVRTLDLGSTLSLPSEDSRNDVLFISWSTIQCMEPCAAAPPIYTSCATHIYLARHPYISRRRRYIWEYAIKCRPSNNSNYRLSNEKYPTYHDLCICSILLRLYWNMESMLAALWCGLLACETGSMVKQFGEAAPGVCHIALLAQVVSAFWTEGGCPGH